MEQTEQREVAGYPETDLIGGIGTFLFRNSAAFAAAKLANRDFPVINVR